MTEAISSFGIVATQAFRVDDPITSKLGAENVKLRANSQRAILLEAFYDHGDGTATEIAEEAGLTHTCYWKRISELRQMGLIAPLTCDGEIITRMGNGSPQMVCGITRLGRRALLEMWGSKR